MRQISTQERSVERIVGQVRALAEGRTIAAGQVTLRANETTTTVTNAIISAASFPVLFPTTASAATAVGAGAVYVGTVSNGSFVITHNSDAATDRTFNWYSLGG